MNFLSKQMLFHPIVASAIGLFLVIASGSAVYYVLESKTPEAPDISLASTTAQDVTATGTVEPSQNPDLAFESAGRIARITVKVGDSVGAGQTLASLDTTALSAQRAQAEAAVAAQDAKLNEMKAGARSVDVSAKQTAVDQASAALDNLYATVPSNVEQAYDKSTTAVSTYTDNLFNSPYYGSPQVTFQLGDYQLGLEVSADRTAVNAELDSWRDELTHVSSDRTSADQALSAGIAHLRVIRTYDDALRRALATAVITTTFTQTSVAAGQAAVSASADIVNGQILALQGVQQQIVNAKLAVQSAQNALAQVQAGSSAEEIASQQAQVDAAKASVAVVDAQIRNALIIAPFSGVVSSVHQKVGDIVSPNTSVVSLSPQSSLQITAYVTELDIARVQVGEHADVTLDAYGSSRHFAATVVSVDHSPSTVNGVAGYRVVLQFTSSDSAISSGMTANITITAH